MLSNKVLITGSSSGLGRTLAILFASNGYDLVICGRDEDSLIELKKQIKALNVNCSIFIGDLAKEETIEKFLLFAKEENIQILINNAAMLCIGKSFQELTYDYINEMVNLNLKLPLLLTNGLFEQVTTVININSVIASEKKKNRTIYCSTKAGLKMFSECLKLETDKHILDVYISKIKKDLTDYGLDINTIGEAIYNSFINKDSELILDGRK